MNTEAISQRLRHGLGGAIPQAVAFRAQNDPSLLYFAEELGERHEIEKKPEHDGLPVLILHGARDQLLGVERARESREAVRPYGLALTYRELEMGHEINAEALRLLVRWLDEKALALRQG